MVDDDMSSTPSKIIEKEICLWAKNIFGLSRDLGLKRHPNTLWKEEIKDFMNVESGGVHHKRYDGHYTKQQVRIPKVIWTSPILGKRSTCRTSSYRASLMKDDVKVKMPNKTSKTLIPLDGMVNWDGVLKFGDKLEGDHACIFKVGWKDLWHEVRFGNVHKQMIWLKWDLWCECYLQWTEINKRKND